ncbi:MAG: hypothetical protein ACRD5L_08140, partial [Bryobacteraceae bacterium]
MRITALPSHESDLVCRVAANGFTVTEAWSPPRRIPWHAHEEHSLTILLEGIFEERYQQVRHPLECRAGSVVVRPAGKGHENRLGRDGGRTLSIELDAARLHVYGKDLAALLALSHQREQAFLDLGMAMSAELRLCDAVGRGDEAPPLGTSLGPLPGTALGTALGTGVDTAAVLALESLTLELLSRLLRMAQEHKSGTPPAWLVSARNAIHDRFR